MFSYALTMIQVLVLILSRVSRSLALYFITLHFVYIIVIIISVSKTYFLFIGENLIEFLILDKQQNSNYIKQLLR